MNRKHGFENSKTFQTRLRRIISCNLARSSFFANSRIFLANAVILYYNKEYTAPACGFAHLFGQRFGKFLYI